MTKRKPLSEASDDELRIIIANNLSGRKGSNPDLATEALKIVQQRQAGQSSENILSKIKETVDPEIVDGKIHGHIPVAVALRRFPEGFAVTPSGRIMEVVVATRDKNEIPDLKDGEGYLVCRIPKFEIGDENLDVNPVSKSGEKVQQKLSDDQIVRRFKDLAFDLEEDAQEEIDSVQSESPIRIVKIADKYRIMLVRAYDELVELGILGEENE